MSRPAPYPADTRAKGWRFELDMEAVKASETWLRARRGFLRGALMLLWGEAWAQTPCGSLPADDELIALLLDMEPADFAANKAVLMRGWWQADDGLLYHDVIVDRVRAMMTKRRSDADRAAARRAQQLAAAAKEPPSAVPTPGVQPESHVTHGGVGDEFDTKHQAPSTSSSPAEKKKAGRKRPAEPPVMVALEALLEAGLDPKTANDFIAHKEAKKAPLTERAWKDHLREAQKAGWSPMDAAEKVMAKNWSGFEAKYVRDEVKPGAGGETAYQRSQRETVHQFTGGLVSKKAPGFAAPTMDVIDATPTTAIAP